MSGYTSHPEALMCDTCLFKSMMTLSIAKRAERVV